MKIYKRRCRNIYIWDDKRHTKSQKAVVYGLTPEEALEFAQTLLKQEYEIKSEIADDREIWGYHYRYYPIEGRELIYLLIEDSITLTNTKTIDMVEEWEI